MYKHPVVNHERRVIFGHSAARAYRKILRERLRAGTFEAYGLLRGEHLPESSRYVTTAQALLVGNGFEGQELSRTEQGNWILRPNFHQSLLVRIPMMNNLKLLLPTAAFWVAYYPTKRWVWTSPEIEARIEDSLKEELRLKILPEGRLS